jgi:hypothetical protein
MADGTPEIRLALRTLERIGILKAAAEGVDSLNEAMTEKGLPASERIGIKTALHRGGFIQ